MAIKTIFFVIFIVQTIQIFAQSHPWSSNNHEFISSDYKKKQIDNNDQIVIPSLKSSFSKSINSQSLKSVSNIIYPTQPVENNNAQFTSIGPYGGSMMDIGLCSQQSDTMYVLSVSNIIYKSINRGENWSALSLGEYVYHSIDVDPNNPNIVYVGGQTYFHKSTNGGITWEHKRISSDHYHHTEGFIISHLDSNIIYGIGSYKIKGKSSVACFLRSLDGGKSWVETTVFDTLLENTWLSLSKQLWAIDKRNYNDIYIGISNPFANLCLFFRSTDGGMTWQDININRYINKMIRCIDVDNNGDIILATEGSGIFKSTDLGESWTQISTTPEILNVIKFLKDDPDIIVGGYNPVYKRSIYKSIDGGGNWVLSNNGIYGNPIRTLVLNSDLEYYIASGTGIFKSIDGGFSWDIKVNGISQTNITTLDISWSEPNTIYAGVSGIGIFKSIDAGENWEKMYHLEDIGSIAIDKTSSNIIYATASGCNDNHIYKSNDDGLTWQQVHLLAIFNCIKTEGSTICAVYKHSTTNYPTLAISTNEGNSWEDHNILLREGVPTFIAINPENQDELYVAGYYGSPYSDLKPSFIYKSIDKGVTWSEIYHDPENGGDRNSVWIDPSNTNAIYFGGKSGILKSIDSGHKWNKIHADHCVSIYLTNNGDIYSISTPDLHSNDYSVVYSVDKGISWDNWEITVDGSWEINMRDNCLKIDEKSKILYFGTLNLGIVKLNYSYKTIDLSINRIKTNSFPEVEMLVSVLYLNQEPVRNLTMDNFMISENNIPQTITSVSYQSDQYLITYTSSDTNLACIKRSVEVSISLNELTSVDSSFYSTIDLLWKVNPADYINAMTMTAQLQIYNEISSDTNDVIGAFIENECRGLAKSTLFPATGNYVFNLTIYSNTAGDEIAFYAYDNSCDTIITLNENQNFIPDGNIGTAFDPIILTGPKLVDNVNPTIEIISPTGGEKLLAGSQNTITWSASDNVGITAMQLLFSSNKRQTWDSLSEISADVYSYLWDVPLLNSSSCWIKIIAYDAEGNSGSDSSGTFLINRPPEIATPSDTTIFEDLPFNFLVVVNKVDKGDSITFYDDTPLFEINRKTGQISFTATNEHVGGHKVTLWVTDGLDSDTADFVLTILNVNDPPLPFNLLSPWNNTIVDTLNPTLIWQETSDQDIGDSLYYNVWLSKDSLFSSLIFKYKVSEAKCTIKEGLNKKTQYFWKVSAVDGDSAVTSCNKTFAFLTSETATGVAQDGSILAPKDFALYQNYPNPFNPTTSIPFDLPKSCNVLIEIYNINGQKIRTLVNGRKQAGWHNIEFIAKDETGVELPSGIYFYIMRAGDYINAKKFTLIK